MWSLRQLPFIIPTRCPVCKKSFTGINPLCDGCLKEIKRERDTKRCIQCGKKLTLNGSNRCLSCIKSPALIDELIVYTDYVGAARELVHKMKFGRNKGLAQFIGTLMGELPLSATDAIVPVPISKKRLIERGFNQSHIIADTLARQKKILLLPVLIKPYNQPPQSELSRNERLKNIRGAFRLIDGIPLPSTVTLVDDVITTGATVNEIARLLKQNGVSNVKAAVFARTPEE